MHPPISHSINKSTKSVGESETLRFDREGNLDVSLFNICWYLSSLKGYTMLSVWFSHWCCSAASHQNEKGDGQRNS